MTKRLVVFPRPPLTALALATTLAPAACADGAVEVPEFVEIYIESDLDTQLERRDSSTQERR